MCKSAFEAIDSICLQPPTHTFPPPTWSPSTYLDNHLLLGQPPSTCTWSSSTYLTPHLLGYPLPAWSPTIYLYLPLTHLLSGYSPTHSFTLPLIDLPTHSFIHPHTACPHTDPPPNIPTYLLIHSPSHIPTHSFTLSSIHLPSHSSTYLPFYLLIPPPPSSSHPHSLFCLFLYFPEIV